MKSYRSFMQMVEELDIRGIQLGLDALAAGPTRRQARLERARHEQQTNKARSANLARANRERQIKVQKWPQ